MLLTGHGTSHAPFIAWSAGQQDTHLHWLLYIFIKTFLVIMILAHYSHPTSSLWRLSSTYTFTLAVSPLHSATLSFTRMFVCSSTFDNRHSDVSNHLHTCPSSWKPLKDMWSAPNMPRCPLHESNVTYHIVLSLILNDTLIHCTLTNAPYHNHSIARTTQTPTGTRAAQ